MAQPDEKEHPLMSDNNLGWFFLTQYKVIHISFRQLKLAQIWHKIEARLQSPKVQMTGGGDETRPPADFRETENWSSPPI